MKKAVFVLVALSITAAFLSCASNEAPDSNVTSEQETEEPVNSELTVPEDEITEEIAQEEEPSTFIELCYATSVNMPEDQFGPENVFDNDPNTSWVTMPGAGPGEGLFFSFEIPIHIDAISMQGLPESNSIAELFSVRLYINGVRGPYYNMHWEETVPIDCKVKSLFIRIIATGYFGTEEPRNGLCSYGSLPVGISEVNLFIKNEYGQEVPLQIQPIVRASGSIQASSSLDPVEAYNPDFLFDSRSDFGWSDGNTESSGQGENLSFHFDQSQRIEKIKIWNGYHRSQTHFDQNERVASISFGLQGEDESVYPISDTMVPQVITLETPLEGQSFSLNILDVYEGATYKDLVISELRFFDGNDWFQLQSGEGEVRKNRLLEWAQNTDAGVFIDRQIYAETWTEESNGEQHFILRSNGSFIVWKQLEMDDSSETMYADGNWQIINDNSVRIFGKLHRMGSYWEDAYDPYSGPIPPADVELDRITIFTDILEFDEETISSQRGVFEDFTF
ncbi:MAG: hypothetical protein KAH31_06730 [Candidatus Sabulitectum sp.]|nr:hypothetical protein [Candidatus Sabulitectum sp.]